MRELFSARLLGAVFCHTALLDRAKQPPAWLGTIAAIDLLSSPAIVANVWATMIDAAPITLAVGLALRRQEPAKP
jgi:hypothetical protein